MSAGWTRGAAVAPRVVPAPCASKVELRLSCRHLLDRDPLTKSDPSVVLLLQAQGQWVQVGGKAGGAETQRAGDTGRAQGGASGIGVHGVWWGAGGQGGMHGVGATIPGLESGLERSRGSQVGLDWMRQRQAELQGQRGGAEWDPRGLEGAGRRLDRAWKRGGGAWGAGVGLGSRVLCARGSQEPHFGARSSSSG